MGWIGDLMAGCTFQFIYPSPDTKNRVHTAYWSDIADLGAAIKEAQSAAAEIGAKIGAYLPGHHRTFP